MNKDELLKLKLKLKDELENYQYIDRLQSKDYEEIKAIKIKIKAVDEEIKGC